MSDLKKKIKNKLQETISPDELEQNTDELVRAAKDSLDIDDDQAKDYVSGLIGVDENVQADKVVQYHSDRTDEHPFTINGVKWQYVNAIYPDGRRDIGVYRQDHDLVYDYKWFMDNVVGGLKSVSDIDEVNKEVMNKFIDQYGKEKGEQIYYATANKQDRDPETFHTEDTGEDYGDIGMQDLEVGADKYEEYRKLMQQLADEEDGKQPVKEDGMLSEGTSDFDLTKSENVSNMLRDVVGIIARYMGTNSTNNGAVANDNRVIFYNMVNDGKFIEKIQQMLPPSSMHYGSSANEYLTNNEQEMVKFLQTIGIDTSGLSFRNMPVREGVVTEGGEPTNDPIKLKADVAKLMAKLDIAAIAPYLDRIDNPAEQAEVIAQFAEKIGVPKNKLGAVVAQLRQVAESVRPKMTKDQLIETVTGKKSKKVIKTVKVKDIK